MSKQRSGVENLLKQQPEKKKRKKRSKKEKKKKRKKSNEDGPANSAVSTDTFDLSLFSPSANLQVFASLCYHLSP